MSIADELQAAMYGMGQGLERQMERSGLSLAVVTNVKDEQKLNRVKCLPIENENAEETDWCYVMAPLGGNGCGQFFFPSVNDLVVLGYLGGGSPPAHRAGGLLEYGGKAPLCHPGWEGAQLYHQDAQRNGAALL